MKISKSKLLATVLILTTVLAMFGVLSITATEYIDVTDYCWIEGVLHSDTYELYPYLEESIDIGFSKYGEMIGYDEDSGIGLGIQYPGYESAGNTYDQRDETSVEPFANEEIDVDVWMNGWFIDIKYKKAPGDWREIWAFAMFSDGSLHGGDWIIMPEVDWDSTTRPLWQEYEPFANPDSDDYPSPKPDYGGRKTNGICTTDDITIVYNGPRKFVAVTKTRIKDGGTSLVDVFITIVFNKAEKNVILLKDVKRLYDKGPLNIQFGNRGEWDLSPPAYVHFYTDEPVQCWDVDGDGDIDPFDEGHEFFYDYMTDNKNPKKWWDEVPEVEWPDYIESEPWDIRKESVEWFETQETCYGREWHTDETIKEHSYAVAQVIDADCEYVGAMGVWPHPEFWSVQNSYPNPYIPPSDIPLMLLPLSRLLEWHKWTVEDDPTQLGDNLIADRNNIWIKMDDMESEPSIPFIIYEHDFLLELGVRDIYRLVSAYVLTDYHDADDADANDLNADTVVENQIDREVQYQLDEIFKPWDLWQDMHKCTKRWVHFFLGNDLTYEFTLPSTKEIEDGEEIPCLPVYPVVDVGHTTEDWGTGFNWDSYCWFPERVLVDGVLIPRDGYQFIDPIPTTGHPSYYEINFITGVITFWEWDSDASAYIYWLIPDDSVVKVLWSSYHSKTVGEQWLGDDETKNFPLHHSILAHCPYHHYVHAPYEECEWLKKYAPFYNGVEVLLVEQEPYRLKEETEGMDSPGHYNVYASQPQSVTDELLEDTVGTHAVGTSWTLDYKFVDPTSVVVYLNSSGAKTTLVEDSDYEVLCLSSDTRHTRVVLLETQTITSGGNITADYDYYGVGYITLDGELIGDLEDWFCKELDVKFYVPWPCLCCDYPGWREEKFHIGYEGDIQNQVIQTRYNLSYPMEFVEKAWIHHEKLLTGGDYVVCGDGKTIYFQNPPKDGEWILANYTYVTTDYEDWFLGDGETNIFVLRYVPKVNTLKVYNTEIWEEILPEGCYGSYPYGTVSAGKWSPKTSQYKLRPVGTIGPPTGVKCPVPDEEYALLPAYKVKTWVKHGYYNTTHEYEECEWIYVTDNKTRGNWIIRETDTCDELVLDQAPEYPHVLKIVYEVYSGRYEWATVGTIAASVDSIGLAMVTAAIKNKGMEMGIGGLDIQDTLRGPRIPWLVDETMSPDTLGRYHLYNDWCYERTGHGMTTSWPISSSNIITVGGNAVNDLAVYSNDWIQALVTTTPEIYGVTCWDRNTYVGGDVDARYGYAIISTFKDKNGTVVLLIAGWTGQDTYYACKWFEEHKYWLQHINWHVTDLVLKIEYKYSDGDLRCPPIVTILEKLGTISEKPQHDCPPL